MGQPFVSRSGTSFREAWGSTPLSFAVVMSEADYGSAVSVSVNVRAGEEMALAFEGDRLDRAFDSVGVEVKAGLRYAFKCRL